MGIIWTPQTNIIPSFEQGYARHSGEAAYPSLWDGVDMAVFPSVFQTRHIRDMSSKNLMDIVDLGASYEGEYRKYTSGWGREHDATGDRTLFTSTIDKLINTKTVTILLGFQKTDATLRANNAFQATNTLANRRCRAILPHTDSKVYWDFGGGVEGTNRLSVAGLTMGDDNWAFSVGRKGMQIWQNGIKVASNSGTPTRVSDATSGFGWGEGISDFCVYRYMIIYHRQLSGEEITLVSKDPFAFLRPKTVTSRIISAGTIYVKSETSTITFADNVSPAGSEFIREADSTIYIAQQVSSDTGEVVGNIWTTPETTPTQEQGYARCAGEAAHPNLWDGAKIALFPNMQQNQHLRDFSGRLAPVDLGTSYQDKYGRGTSGLGREHTSDTEVTEVAISNDDALPENEVTILLGYEKTDAVDRKGEILSNDGPSQSSSNMCQVFVDTSNVTFIWGSGIPGAGEISTATTTGDDDWVFQSGSTGQQIWQNGSLIKTQPGYQIRGNTHPELPLKWGTDYLLDRGDLGIYKYMVIYDRKLSAAEIKLVSDNPLAMLVPKKVSVTGNLFKVAPGPEESTPSVMSLSDTVSYFLAIDDFKPVSHTLAFSQTVLIDDQPYVEHDLLLSDSATQTKVGSIPESITQPLGINDSIVYCTGTPWGSIEVEHILGLSDLVGRGLPQSVADSLGLTTEAYTSEPLTHEIVFQQFVSAGIGHGLSHDLDLDHSIDSENLFSRAMSHSDILQDAAAFYFDTGCARKNYNRYEGSGSAGAIGPKPLTFDASLALETLSGPKEVLALRNPETDDRRRIGFQRINRETRGGELGVFSDSMWPQVDTLLYTIVALSDGKNRPDKINALMDFLQNNLGVEILIHDWEGITWRGVVTTPNETAVEDRDGWWTISFEFEGIALDGSSGDQSLAFSDSVIVGFDRVRSLSHDLGVTDDTDVSGILSGSDTDGLSLTSLVLAEAEHPLMEDTFVGAAATDLNGQSPVTGGSVWSAHTNYKADGSQTAINSGAYYPFAPQSGKVYHIEWEARSLAENDGDETMFFLAEGLPSDPDDTGPVADGGIDPTTLKAGFVMRKLTTQQNACRLGDNTSGAVDTANFTDAALLVEADDLDMRIVLDTRNGAGTWTVVWYAKTPAGSWTEVRAEHAVNEDITAVGWANNNTTTTVTMNSISIIEKETV